MNTTHQWNFSARKRCIGF